MRTDIRKIGIIGAGVSGLIAAKTFLEEGFDCEIFERKESLGGVWENGYHSLHLQLPKESYEFLDWPMPASYPDFPSCDQIVSYLNSYARHFRVLKRIRFQCDVTKLERRPNKGGWSISYFDKKSESEFVREFDLVIVCNGLYSTPKLPTFPNQEKYTGRIVHSSLAQGPKLASYRNIVVVGFGKSALDLAEYLSNTAESVTLVYRKSHWPVPRKILGLIDSKYMISRFVSAFLPLYIHPGKWEKRLHRFGGWIVKAFWRMFELIIRVQFRLKSANALPTSKIEQDIFTGDFVASPNIYPLIHQDKIHTQKTSIKRFTEDGLELDNGEILKADMVVMGTGWQYDGSFLPEELKSLIEDDGLYLYRHMIHPVVSDLVFVGLASTFNNSLSDYLEARWLVATIKGEVNLPDKSLMLQEIEDMKAWKRKIMPDQGARASLLQVHALHYHDQLLKDLNINPRRKKNWFAEIFGAYLPSDYKAIPSVFVPKNTLVNPVAAMASFSGGVKSSHLYQHMDIDLTEYDLSVADLYGASLESIDLSQRNLQAADLRHANLYGANLSGSDLAAAQLSGADLTLAELFNTDFTGAAMSRINLERAFLIESNLSLTYLHGANLSGAHLSGANLAGARLNNAQITGADLTNANLKDCDLRGANLENSDLSNADLTGADLRDANLKGATLMSANFTNANISNVKFNEKETCKDIQIAGSIGNALFKRYAQDQAYVEEYKVNYPLKYMLWKYSSDCGRSLTMWVFWCAMIAFGFSLVFHFHLGGSESFAMTELAKEPGYNPKSWAPMLYYSVVTFTTLGFGDIVPRTQEAAWWITAEVVLGYLMLGGLITILATKLARRS